MFKTITGNKASLRLITLNDATKYKQWVKDEEVTKYSLSKWQKLYTPQQINDWLNKIVLEVNSINLAVIDKHSGDVIGHAGISAISQANRSGEYFIFIGEKSFWNKGIGTEVTRLVVDYGFRALHLHRIMLTVSDLNAGGVRAYLKAGFKHEGIMRDASFRDGNFHNKIVMSILETEWQLD
jgi:RimJ/RimL family protein N-acetyltransferase